MRSLKNLKSFHKTQTKTDMEIKLTSIEAQNNAQAHRCNSCIAISSIVHHALGMQTAIITYCIILHE